MKSIPGVALFLASSIEPVEQSLAYPEAEIAQASYVISNTVIIVVAHKNLVQFLNHLRQFPCSHIFYALVDLPAFLPELLPAGFPLYSELPVPA